MRLFVALPLPELIRTQFRFLMAGVPGARWVEPEALHLTLRFLGETDEVQAEELDQALAAIELPRFDLSFTGTGHFSTGDRPHTLWASAEPNDALLHLQAKIERAAIGAGFDAETRRFTPHVTLARLRDAPSGRVARFLIETGGFRTGPFTVESFVLFESLRGSAGPVYHALGHYALR